MPSLPSGSAGISGACGTPLRFSVLNESHLQPHFDINPLSNWNCGSTQELSPSLYNVLWDHHVEPYEMLLRNQYRLWPQDHPGPKHMWFSLTWFTICKAMGHGLRVQQAASSAWLIQHLGQPPAMTPNIRWALSESQSSTYSNWLWNRAKVTSIQMIKNHMMDRQIV